MTVATIKMRDALLPRLGGHRELCDAREGWIQLREERHYPIIIPRIVGKRIPPQDKLRPYQRASFRVPPLCLSKYSKVDISSHQLIMTDGQTVSGDTFEDPVVEEDGHWYEADKAFELNGQSVLIPRLRYHNIYRGPDRVFAEGYDELPIREIEGPVLSILSWWGGANLSHWMVDCLPRLWALPFIHEPDLRLMVPQSKAPFVAESLELMGFGPERVIPVNNGNRYAVETLYVPSRVGSHYNFFSEEIISFYRSLRDRVANFKRGTDELIYVSRRDATSRRCVEEEQFEKELEKRGFRIVVMTELSFAERLELMAGCRFVVGECGAGLTTSLMMPDHSTVLVTGTPEMMFNAALFTNIASQKRQEVLLFAGTALDDGRPDLIDWSIDVEDAVKAIDRALATIGSYRGH